MGQGPTLNKKIKCGLANHYQNTKENESEDCVPCIQPGELSATTLEARDAALPGLGTCNVQTSCLSILVLMKQEVEKMESVSYAEASNGILMNSGYVHGACTLCHEKSMS